MTQAAQLAQYGANNVGLSFKNRIINGDMTISQRNGTSSITANTTGEYTLDRWKYFITQTGKFTVQQNAGGVTPPAGFTNYLGVTSTSAYSVISSDYFDITQPIEGFNVADLGWGTANAQTITVSFWVRSSLTGTFGGGVTNSAYNRSYPFPYTINAANTWEYKTVTIPGDTTGTWLTDNSRGIELSFGLGNGSSNSGTANTWQSGWDPAPTGAVSVVGTSGATWYVTGVQFEKGTVATSFDYLPYTTELQLCQRYCVKFGGDSVYEHLALGMAYSTSGVQGHIYMPVPMRALPSATISGNWVVQDGAVNTSTTGFGFASSGAENSTKIVAMFATTGGGLTQFRPYMIMANNSTASSYILSAEL